ncbi:preprotein translocase subunit SecE [uncultured Corynebacterium sp.]|uniref:preprotein translocase subunit SecE n=1 Tax=uncultured Corynebacterium sp. TaxID=159447 RepID=UPI002602E8CF|nr:preprotein translocase subunit SecE [uncultured Corynebacterium sp.]
MTDNQPGRNTAKPTGKRQRSGASSVTSDSYEAKRVDKTAAEDNDKPGNGVAAFPGEVVGEMRKVVWPTSKQMLNYTLIVFGFLIVLTALVWGVDQGAAWVVEKVLVP